MLCAWAATDPETTAKTGCRVIVLLREAPEATVLVEPEAVAEINEDCV
ncbi:hypothetical protein HW509_08805 [Asaia spathodeae]